MNITIKTFGLPALLKTFGASYTLSFGGNTIKDLIEHLIILHPEQLRPILLDERTGLNASIQILINRNEFIGKKEYTSRELRDGDTVTFMLLAAGG